MSLNNEVEGLFFLVLTELFNFVILKKRLYLYMDRDFLIKLTNDIYGLTLLFPKKEPLRYKIREIADNILAKPNEKDLEILDSFLEVAMAQNWAKASGLLAIQKEYANLRGGLKKTTSSDQGAIIELGPRYLPQNQPVSEKTERQEKILAFLKESGRVQVWQVKQVFPEVTKRTLRRDFEKMLGQGLIERVGERNATFYQLRSQASQIKTSQA